MAVEPDRRIPFSPLVLTPDELACRLAAGDTFYQEIVRWEKALAFIQFTEDTWTPAR